MPHISLMLGCLYIILTHISNTRFLDLELNAIFQSSIGLLMQKIKWHSVSDLGPTRIRALSNITTYLGPAMTQGPQMCCYVSALAEYPDQLNNRCQVQRCL